MNVLEHTMLGIDRILNGSSKGPQQPMPGSPALVEGPSPTVDARTAGVDIQISQYRQEVYGYERLIERMYDLARANRYDELHDVVRAKYLSIHGSRG